LFICSLIVEYQFIELHGIGTEGANDLQAEVLHILRLIHVEPEYGRLLSVGTGNGCFLAVVEAVKVGELRPLVARILLAI
jgi:hypothetical protein